MQSSDSTRKESSRTNLENVKDFKIRRDCGQIIFLLLAKRGYNLSNDVNSPVHDFCIGRNVDVGEDDAFNDIILTFGEKDNTKLSDVQDGLRNLIFMQMYYQKDESLTINSHMLSGKEISDFNLQNFFIPFLSIREDLNTTKYEKFKNGKIRYFAVLTNIGLDFHDLNDKAFRLKEAPEDIKTLCSLNESSSTSHYQLYGISTDLQSALKECSDLHRLAREIARYAVLKEYGIMGVMDESSIIKYYHVALRKEVFELSSEIHTEEEKSYCVAYFRDDFIDLLPSESEPKYKLREEIFKAIKRIAQSKEDVIDEELEEKLSRDCSDTEMKEILRNARWKVDPYFGDDLPRGDSEIRKMAEVFAEYIATEIDNGKMVLGKKGTPITRYEAAIEKEVIEISDQVIYKPAENQKTRNEEYCVATFRRNFINNNEIGRKLEIRNAIFDAVRKRSGRNLSDDELKSILMTLELKIAPNFGNAQKHKENLENKWVEIEEKDIVEFLSCLVFLVNQPNIVNLETQIYLLNEIFVQGNLVGEALRDRDSKSGNTIEELLGIYKKDTNKEMWLYYEEIEQYIEKLQESFLATFRDYSKAKTFIDWLMKEPLDRTKLVYLTEIILKKPDYKFIRAFMNLILEKIAKTEHFAESLTNFRKIAESFLEEQTTLIDDEKTMLHYAIEEGNQYIIWFLVKCFRGEKDEKESLKDFLFNRLSTKRGNLKNVLHLASEGKNAEIVKILLDAAAEISEDVLQEFLYSSDRNGNNPLFLAVTNNNNVQVLEELLRRANNKLDFIQRKGGESTFIEACSKGKEKFIDFFLQEFQHDKASVKQLLLFEDGSCNCLYNMSMHKVIIVKLLSIAKSMDDNDDTLKKMLTHKNKGFFILEAVRHENIDVVQILLNSARDINDDYHTLKQLIFSDVGEGFVLHTAAEEGHRDFIKLLLQTATGTSIRIVKEVIFTVNRSGKNLMQIVIEKGESDIVKLLLETTAGLSIEMLEELILTTNRRGENAVQVAIKNGHRDIVKLLLQTAVDVSVEMLEALIFAVNVKGKNAIELLVLNDNKNIFEDFLKMLEGNMYQDIRNKVNKIFIDLPLEDRLVSEKIKLFESVLSNEVQEIVNVLDGVKHSDINPDEKLKILLLATTPNVRLKRTDVNRCLSYYNKRQFTAFQAACALGHSAVIKILLGYAISLNDGGATLNEMLTSRTTRNTTAFEELKDGYNSEIKNIIKCLIDEARNTDKGSVANILVGINIKYTIKSFFSRRGNKFSGAVSFLRVLIIISILSLLFGFTGVRIHGEKT